MIATIKIKQNEKVLNQQTLSIGPLKDYLDYIKILLNYGSFEWSLPPDFEIRNLEDVTITVEFNV